jgi:hypothetical protein
LHQRTEKQRRFQYLLVVYSIMLSGLPAFELFNCANRCSLEELIPGAILVAFVVFLSSFAGAKKFAMQAMGGVMWVGSVS